VREVLFPFLFDPVVCACATIPVSDFSPCFGSVARRFSAITPALDFFVRFIFVRTVRTWPLPALSLVVRSPVSSLLAVFGPASRILIGLVSISTRRSARWPSTEFVFVSGPTLSALSAVFLTGSHSCVQSRWGLAAVEISCEQSTPDRLLVVARFIG
jgi:hypothetical protein